MNSRSNSFIEDDEDTNLRPKVMVATNPTQRSNLTEDSSNRSNVSINILRNQSYNHNNYSSINDDLNSVSVASFDGRGANGGHSVESQVVDMEALLTMALESTTQKVDRENRKRQNMLLAIVGIISLLSLCILSTVTLSEYPEEHELHSQIGTLERDVDQLHGELDTFESDEDIDLLRRDIEDKKMMIQQLEQDTDLDPKEKIKLVNELQGQINDLKVQVQDLEETEAQEETDQANQDFSGGGSN